MHDIHRRLSRLGLARQLPNWLWLIVGCYILGASATIQAAPLETVDAYFASSLWTGTETVQDAVLVVADGKVVAVGQREKVDLPAQATVHKLGSVMLMPGLVIAQSNLGDSSGNDEFAVRPEVRAADGFDPFDDYRQLLAGGITTVQLSPSNNRLMPGQGAVVKLAGADPQKQILAVSESLSVVLTRAGLSPPTVYEPPVGAVSVERPVEPTRPQLATSLAQAVVGLRALFAAAADSDEENIDDELLASLSELMREATPLRWTVENAAEVRAALQLSEEVGLPWLIVDPVAIDDLLAVSDWNAASVKGVILNAELRPGRISNPPVPGRLETPDMPLWTRAAKLIEAGAADKLALRAATDADLDKILYLATVLGRAGIEREQVLRMLTVNPANMMGVSDRVGSLAAGLDADFVVVSGEPTTAASCILATYVDGRKVFDAQLSDVSTVISAGHIVTPGGIVTGGRIAVAAGKIRGVGRSVSSAKSALVKDFGEAYVVPGFIDMGTSLGIGGSLSESIPLGTKLGELLSRDDAQIGLARQGGVTTALLGSTRLPSPVVAFKLSDAPVALKDPVAIRFEIDDNLTAAESSLRRTLQSGKTYADAWNKYDSDFAEYEKKLLEYEKAKAKYDAAVKAAEAKKQEEATKQADAEKKSASPDGEAEKPTGDLDNNRPADQPQPDEKEKGSSKDATKDNDAKPAEKPSQNSGDKSASDSVGKSQELVEPKQPDEPKKPKQDDNLEPYRDLFKNKIVALVEVSEVKAVELAVKLFREEFKLKTALVAGSVAAKNATLLAKQDVLAVVGPELVAEEEGELVNFAAELALAQVPIAFQSKAATGVKELPQAISYAIYEGLGADDALAGLTSVPSHVLGLDAVGSIEAGKDADLVVLSGPPLELSSEVLAVMIDGRWVYEKEIE